MTNMFSLKLDTATNISYLNICDAFYFVLAAIGFPCQKKKIPLLNDIFIYIFFCRGPATENEAGRVEIPSTVTKCL